MRIIFAVILMSIIVVSGCTNIQDINIQDIIQVAGYIEAEAKVVGIELDENLICNPRCNKNQDDYILVKFERIISIDDHIKEGFNLDLNETYKIKTDCTARPAIRRWYPMGNRTEDLTAFREGEYIVCPGNTIRVSQVTEEVMPGLKINDRIHSSFFFNIDTGKFLDMKSYEVI